MGEERAEINPPKFVLIIAMLFVFLQGITFFYGGGLGILYGILCLVFVFLIFISLDLIGLGPLKLPYWWWLMLIIGVLSIVFDFLNGGNYLAGILVLLAVLMELIGDKIKLEGCKFMVFFGILFSIWDCIVVFINYTAGYEIYLVNAIFGLIILIILVILLFDFVDIKIPFNWWVVLIIAFVIYWWVSIPVMLIDTTGYPIVGLGGTVLMIGFVCMVKYK